MTERRSPFEVEPLSERRWNAIEGRLLERLDQPVVGGQAPTASSWRGPFTVGLIAATSAAAVVVFAWLSWPPATGPVARRFSTARVMTGEGEADTLAGDVAVHVGPASSVIVFESEPGAWVVAVEHGRARFGVPPRGPRPPFVVEAGEVRVEVVGTRFEVVRAPGAASASVAVDDGTVRVVARGDTWMVHAGEQWPMPPVQGPAPHVEGPVPASTVPAPAAEARAPRARLVAHGPTTGGLRAQADPSGEDPTGPGSEEISPTPDMTAVAEGVTASETPAAPAASSMTPRERFMRAQSLEAVDSRAALVEYAALASSSGAWSANALFAQGRLELELGNSGRARRTLERYLVLHPEGINAEDARRLLDELR